ncbi:MAG: anti-sigma factor family protein [Gemmatimonadaceae bacterium]
MQHPDEGTIHAWLDGAIPEVEARAIEAHVTTCEQCASAVAEARGLMAASSRILSALDGVPGSVVPASSAIPVTRAGAAMAVTTYERRRRLGMYARIAAALAFVTAGGITLAHVGDQGLRPGDVRDAAAAVAATAAAATAAAPAVAATAVPSRESQSLQMEVTKPAPSAAAQAARRREKSAEAATASQRARVARDAAADAYAHVDSINRFGAERFLSEARVAPAPGAAPAASSAAPTSAQAANRAAEMKVAGMRPTALLDSADSVHGFSLVSGSVRTDPVRGVEHRRYEVRPGVFVSLEITPVRGTAVPDSAYRVGDTNVLRWTEGARQYVLSGPVTVAELRKMKESDAIR